MALLSTSDTDLLGGPVQRRALPAGQPERGHAAGRDRRGGGPAARPRCRPGAKAWPRCAISRGQWWWATTLPDAALMTLSTVRQGWPPRRTTTWPTAARTTCGAGPLPDRHRAAGRQRLRRAPAQRRPGARGRGPTNGPARARARTPTRGDHLPTGPTSWPGTLASIDRLCEAVADQGARPLPVWCASLPPSPNCCETGTDTLRGRAHGQRRQPGAARPGRGDDEAWDTGAIATLGRAHRAARAVPDRAPPAVGDCTAPA